jgi:hypothetical protein
MRTIRRGVCRGTTLIAIKHVDGIVMAADDLMYTEVGGHATPQRDRVQKIFPMGDNILIGSAGVLSHPTIHYWFEDWLKQFIENHQGTTSKRPSDVADALAGRLQETFHVLDSNREDEIWKIHKRGDRIVSYFVAGYAESFQQPYVFELGAEIDNSGIRYISPKRLPSEQSWLGEDHYWRRAESRCEPEFSSLRSIVKTADIGAMLPDACDPFREIVAWAASLIKVESQYNPTKVGHNVTVGVIDRGTRKASMLYD